MAIGDVIKKYRKNKGMTQEEMAICLGVTTPAVNKWERGNTLPDVALLAPIARLLGITTDELLSFKDNLTDEETNQYLLKIQKDLENKDFHDVFLSVKEKIEEYPNCENLIWQAAVILDAKRMTIELPNKDNYDNVIFRWYERCLLSEDERIRNQAADSLFHAFVRKEDYEKAAQYLDYFSLENPERKRKEALVNSKTGKRTEAYRAYEELIYSGYQHIQMVLNDLRILYTVDDAGIPFSSGKWVRVQPTDISVRDEKKPILIDDVIQTLDNQMISYQTKNAGAAGETLSSTIQECEVIYKLDKASGMYRPVFRFCMQDGISYDVDLLTLQIA